MVDSALLLGVASAALAAAGTSAVLLPPTRRLAPRVRPYTVVARTQLGHGADAGDLAGVPATGSVRGVLGPAVHLVGRRIGRVLDRRTDDALERALRQAGFVDATPDAYRVRVVLHVLGFGAAGIALGVLVLHSALFAVGLAACGVMLGATRLRGRVDRSIAARRERIRLELYTVNQLLAMHVRTGAGPIQATQRVVDRGDGIVIGELRAALAAMHSGVAEATAFRQIADVTPEPAAARTYKLFAAGTERGVDLADALRALSEDLRDARREEIRQTATKRRAAMLVPTIAVLAPVMLLFIAAPLPSIVFGSH